MGLRVHYQNVKFQLKDSSKVKKWLSEVVKEEGKVCGDIAYFFIDQKSLREINIEFLEHDYETDVITFDYCEKYIVNGEVYIGIETVKNNAEKFSSSFRKEYLRVMLHGALHLLGYKDNSREEKIIMRAKEEYYLIKWEQGEF